MTRRSDDEGPAPVDPRFDPAFQRGTAPAPHAGDAARDGTDPSPAADAARRDASTPGGEAAGDPDPVPPARTVVAAWLAPALWVLAVAFPAAGLGLRALGASIASSMPYSSFGDPLGPAWLLDAVPLLVTLAPGIVAGGPMAVIAALAVHAVRRRPA
ncbi:hypothetical protein [Clavibacter michiganensis]|uniref:hypothetical protein n=1 Tax=Clavibacter michiganensis TaxID=28447 RepID=UPI00215722A2|nr:hypothetical protein [Clavibacter michiganensis]